mgnify:CR=1 FL=1
MFFTITTTQLFLYFGALIILFVTPGPVWIAIVARTISGGPKSALSLIFGVCLGDMLWPIIVFLGIGFFISVYSDYLIFFRLICSLILATMGLQIVLNSKKSIIHNTKLNKKGFFSGFSAGFLAVTANPKAALFYLTLLPSFFNFLTINTLDLSIISFITFSVPFTGNLLLIYFLTKMRKLISSEKSMFRLNFVSGIMLIFVAILILANY